MTGYDAGIPRKAADAVRGDCHEDFRVTTSRSTSRRLASERFNQSRCTLVISFPELPPPRVHQVFGTAGMVTFTPGRVPKDLC
jgi:hypothetical protein